MRRLGLIVAVAWLLFLGALARYAHADGCISSPTTNFSATPVSVGTSATQLAQPRCRFSITIINGGLTVLTVGPTSGVTTSNGGNIPAGASLTLQTNSAVYGISTASEIISVFETF